MFLQHALSCDVRHRSLLFIPIGMKTIVWKTHLTKLVEIIRVQNKIRAFSLNLTAFFLTADF